ncbi:MAG: class I SAM-dependent methyltransferase [Candidatus Aenigmarchaeota archaeon]|nr:class I SAM-dependent methyltransferase [Candidatus Aenigmarchaeota archaeon]
MGRVKDGNLTCQKCDTKYKIKNGLINLLYPIFENYTPLNEQQLKNEIIKAVKSNDEKKCYKLAEDLASLNLNKTQNRMESIKLIMKDYSIISDIICSNEQEPILRQSATLARYDLEIYKGTYKSPDECLETIKPCIDVNNGIVVEGASGPGDNLLYLREKLNSRFYIGIDVSNEQTKQAQKKTKDNAAEDDTLFVQGDICELPLKDAIVSLYTVNNAWDRIPKPRNAAEEAKRILKSVRSGIIYSNCIPLQYEVIRDEEKDTYVLIDQRFDLKDLVKISGCKLVFNKMYPDAWNVCTLRDGQETLSIQVVAGVRW